MRTISLEVTLTYDEDQMYSDPTGLQWFFDIVLGGDLELLSAEIGDVVGSLKVVKVFSPTDLTIHGIGVESSA